MSPAEEDALRARRRLLLVALALVLLSEALSVAGIGKGVHDVVITYVRFGHRVFSAALLASAFVFITSAPQKSRHAAIALGVGAEIIHAVVAPERALVLSNLGGWFGIAAIAVAAADAVRLRAADPRRALLRLFEASIFPAYVVIAFLPLDLTVFLHPYSVDPRLLALDASIFGGQPSFVLGGWFADHGVLRIAEGLVYIELPVAAAVLFVLERRAGRQADVQIAFLVAGLVGIVLYHAAPAAGPSSYWPLYPKTVPSFDDAFVALDVAQTRYRNCVPSLHTTWALFLYWHARPFGWRARVPAGVWLVATVAAMLGLGEHYLSDVLIAVPFAVAMRAALARRVPLREPVRWSAIAVSAGFFLTWLALVRAPPEVLLDSVIFRPFAIVSTIATLLFERRLRRWEVGHPEATAPPISAPTPAGRRGAIVAAIFFASGFAGLVYEVVFSKWLALVFGSTAVASTTVLATYMGGMALGSYVGGRVRTRSALRTYGLCELGVAIACGLSPLIVAGVRAAYVGLASGGDPDRPSLVVLQVALGALVLLPPTVLMGMTLPVLSRYFAEEDATLGRSVALLYTSNTFGAAAGAFLAGYVLLPSLGVLGSTAVGVVLNLGVALGALRLAARPLPPATAAALPDGAGSLSAPARVGWLGLAVLGAGGLVSLALEITYTHLLAVVVGNSTFAFSSMLVAFLVGLAGGAWVGRAWLRAQLPLVSGIGLAQAGLVLAVLGGVFAWNGVPDYFASYALFTYARTFAITELVRFMVCACLLLPPAFFVGLSYPLAIEAVLRASTREHVRALGNAAATNTVGNITGALVASFVLIPRLGSLRTLHSLMGITATIAVAALILAVGERTRRALGGVLAVALALALVQPASFDLSRLASGSNVYFMPQYRGEVIDHAESMDGGMTTVTVAPLPDGDVIKTLLTNGTFQGDNSAKSEMRAQYGFTLLPLLHTTARGPALAIGFGTGTSARALSDAGFSEVHVAELSRDIVEMSRRHFSNVNGSVADRPNVSISYTDGRNYLLLQDAKFDFIGVEISSIWFAGAASLYNVELYELAKRRLTERGIFQQWIQLHHVDASDIASMFASVRTVFPEVWFYVAGGQGIVVACAHDCPPSAEAAAKIDATPALAEGLVLYGGKAERLARARMLGPAEVDRLLAAAGASPPDAQHLAWLASTDDNSFLEYHTPHGNVRREDESTKENIAMLRRFAARP